MHKGITYIALILVGSLLLSGFCSPDWGFYGHRKINRMAVFTLPPEMISFFKTHIEYLTEHAVDPDKRRYATKHEAVRHYIDIDHWDSYPFEKVPRQWHDAILYYADFQHIVGKDTTTYHWPCNEEKGSRKVLPLPVECDSSFSLFYGLVNDMYYKDAIKFEAVALNQYADSVSFTEGEIHVVDNFSTYGILPYHLASYYQKLVAAFASRETSAILRLCAEIGHYIGDAHVPLHTTENYNGQFTDQIGIHGFWESRLPELFADDTYDFFVGRAEYIDQVKPYFWKIVLDSHSHLDEVLAFEKSLSQSFPQDQQYCFEERLEVTIKTQCEVYASAYHTALDGMVELRMQDAILSIGSIWMSAWIDAGQPDLNALNEALWSEKEAEQKDSLDFKFRIGNIFGREHGN